MVKKETKMDHKLPDRFTLVTNPRIISNILPIFISLSNIFTVIGVLFLPYIILSTNS